jgi:hypothetical protein
VFEEGDGGVTLLIAWLVFPLLLAVLCLGCGLLVEALTCTRIPAAMLVPVGLTVVVVVGTGSVWVPACAKLTTPLVAALAAAGIVLARRRRVDLWAWVASAATYLCYLAPVLASGAATFAGYIKLDDTATFLALTDRILEHGRSLAGLPPSSYEATLSVNLPAGYPIGSLIPLGIGHELARTDAAWLYQPWLSFCAGVVALSLYSLAEPMVPRRPIRALMAFVAAQSALLFGYALWGGVKELAASALIATAAATAPTRNLRGARAFVPFAIACAAVVDALSVAGVVWLLPLIALVAIALRRTPVVIALGAAVAALLALPALTNAPRFLSGTTVNTLESGSVLGNLVRPLRPLQLFGIWPSGDFRLEPTSTTATALLVAIAVAAAAGGVVLAIVSDARRLLLATTSAVFGAVVFVTAGGPWVAAKALAIGSPFVLLTALAGCIAIASRAGALGRTVGYATVGVGILAASAIAAGVAWSDMLAYHDVALAPRGQLRELEQIGERFAGDGPALMTEYQPYGVRHFLRRLDAEGVSELRRRPIMLRSGRIAGKGEYVDLDQITLPALLLYRTLVLRRSPTASRPPSNYALAWRGHWYEVWQRSPAAAPVRHLPLGGPLQVAARPACTTVRKLAARGRLVAVQRPRNLVWPVAPANLPRGWTRLKGGAVAPERSGAVDIPILLRRGGHVRLWVGGSIRGTLSASIDGMRVGTVTSQLQNAGQWLDLGSANVERGAHTVSLAVTLGASRPGTGGDGFPLGPLLLQPQRPASDTVTTAARAAAFCSRSLDWVEILPRVTG